MKLLPPLRGALPLPHQGGWDEILIFIGGPMTLFIILRWLGIRRERREQQEQGESSG